MHIEWFGNMSDEVLSGHPEWVMEKYFVDGSGQPDTTKTTEVVGIPYPRYSSYRTSQLCEAASRVGGLHQATGLGSTQTIYLGWDQDAVEKAAKDHGAKEALSDKAKADAREEERASRHERYLAEGQTSESGPRVPSPAGQYIVDCEEIEGNWPDMARDMKLAIRGTPTFGIYEASFDFGVVEGLMILSSDETVLHRFCARFDDEDDEEDDEDNEEDDEDDEDDDDKNDKEDEEEDDGENSDCSQDESADGSAVGSKRKAKAKAQAGRPSKKAKTVRAGKPSKYFLRLKSRVAGTGEIHPTAQKGVIRFNGPGLSSFTGEVSIGGIGSGVIFTARKISAVPPKSWESWEDYSEAAYERARVDRWR